MKCFHDKMQISAPIRIILCLMLFFLSLDTSYSQTYELYAGESKTLPEPTPPAGYITGTGVAEVSNSDCVSATGRNIWVKRYFSGTVTVTVQFPYSYTGTDNKTHVNHFDHTYYIKAKPLKVSLNKSDVTLYVGDDDYELSYETSPSGYEPYVVWSTSDVNVASLNTNNEWGNNEKIEGVSKVNVYPRSEGTCTIRCGANTGSEVPTCKITVVDLNWVKADVSGGVVDKGTKVTLTSTKSGATIYYTTDGSEPTKSSNKYTSPITINESLTLKAKAYTGNQESRLFWQEYEVYPHKEGEVFKAKTVEGVELTFKVYKELGSLELQVGDGVSPAINQSYSGKITIPSSVDGMLVDRVSSKAFYGSSITSLSVVNWPRYYEPNCFQNCKKLTAVEMEHFSEFFIMSEAFKDCVSLEKIVNKPNNGNSSCGDMRFAKDRTNTVVSFSNKVFENCNNIKSIYIERDNSSRFNDDIFPSSVYNNATVYVKKGAIYKYQNTSGWKNFNNIKEIGDETNPRLSLSASPSSGSVEPGTKVYLTAKADGSTVSSADIYYTTNGTSPSKSSQKYTSSGISITQDCTLKAIAYKDGYETSEVESWSYTIKSSTVEPTSISVSPSTKTIEVGETFTPTYSLTPSNASTTVTWSSDDSSIASVDSNTGLVTGIKAGKTYINATTANGKTNWCTVTVTSSTPSTIVPTSISVSPSHKTIKVGGDGFYCSYTISPSNANSQTSVTWSSVDSSIATVSSSGCVTGKKAGFTWIKATTANGKTSLCTVTVTEAINLELNIKQAAAGYHHSLFLETDGTLWACGWNPSGQLGDGTTTTIEYAPVQVVSDVAQVSAGDTHTMILKTDGTLWACGKNSYGRLGDGTTTDRKTPVKVTTDVAQVSAGGYHTMILKTDGTLWACGHNPYGQLGDGTATDRKTPVKVMTDVAQVSAGESHTMILRNDGSLWACGYNLYGRLGDGTTTDRKTPVKVATDVAQVSAGGEHTMILKSNGTLWACGDNGAGQLGDGTINKRITPVQVMTDVAQVSAGRFHTMILKTDGTLWACGSNYYGGLGDGTTTSKSAPVQVMSDVAQVSAGEGYTMIVKTDGTLWACGWNNYGQLGDGTTIDRKSFVKIAESNILGNEITVKTSDAGYATFYSSGFAYTLPYGLSAQVVTSALNNKLTYKTIADGSVSGVVPSGTAVMLVTDFRKPATYTMKTTASSAPYLGTNLLRGSDEATTTTGNGYHYKLSYGQSGSNLSNVFGWYWGAQNGAPFQIEGHKAWLVVPKSSSSTRGFAIGGEATGIEMVSGDDNVEADAVYYDLQGRRITKPTVKGVYIKNGKKVMVK